MSFEVFSEGGDLFLNRSNQTIIEVDNIIEIPQIINILKGDMSIADFYANHISPYKGELEMWYQQHLSFYTDFMLIFLTAWAIVSPDSNLVYKVFKDLPKRPSELN